MRNISRFEVGSMPAKPQTFQFYDEDGNYANLGPYTNFDVELLGTDNEKVNLDGLQLNVASSSTGRVVIVWPRRKEVFGKTGQYLLRFKFTGTDSVDFSETHEIRVTNFGRITN